MPQRIFDHGPAANAREHQRFPLRDQQLTDLQQKPRGAFGQIADTMHVEDEAIRAGCHLDQLPDDEFRAIECHLALQAVTLDPGRDLPQPNRQFHRADSSRRKIERREHAA